MHLLSLQIREMHSDDEVLFFTELHHSMSSVNLAQKYTRVLVLMIMLKFDSVI